MSSNRLLDLVDQRDFRTLFIEELGWDNPDHTDVHHEIDGTTYTLTNIASFKGLRIWHCPQLPPRPVQRQIDELVGRDTLERLVIFTSEHKQEWRWPRRSQLAAANTKLLAHPYVPGDPNYRTLAQRLQAIELDFDEDITLVTLLERMRAEFDREAETASAQAARLMRGLYAELETVGVDEHNVTLLLARLLFLLFGDDAGMWKPAGLFETYLHKNTTAETLHTDLVDLFAVLDTDERKRNLPADSPYRKFRYINGGLFKDPQDFPPLTSTFRELLLQACSFDWSIISPAIFGGMFQTVKSKEARREAGEHYTSEKNILKTIGPLFLEDYRARLEKAKHSKRELTLLHNELGSLQYLDPACGCGNFLIVAYREMRALELELLKLRRDLDLANPAIGPAKRAQLTLDVSTELNVRLDQFYGFEISEWPARIAETAMLLVDHLANQQMAEEFGIAPDRLPINISANIVHGNALDLDWSKTIPRGQGATWLFGNPPFIGQYTKTAAQTIEMKNAWGDDYDGYLDYVTAWHAKSRDLLTDRSGEFAYVTTNSITQGQPVPALFKPLYRDGWDIKFAHRTFAWDSEAPGKAAVHCVIVGFTKDPNVRRRLWDYPSVLSEPVAQDVEVGINAYLIDAPRVLVEGITKPLSPVLPPVTKGSQPTDDGNLVFKEAERCRDLATDRLASKYLRRFVGAREMLHNIDRRCLWLVELNSEDLRGSAPLRRQLDAVAAFRTRSSKTSTQEAARTPHLFTEIRQPDVPYLCIPSHVSETRRFWLTARYDADVICGNANFLAPDEDGLLFALISSSMFIAWQRAVGGRIKSDLRFSNKLTWNTFPVPALDAISRDRIIRAGKDVLNARQEHSNHSLAKLYDPRLMGGFKELQEAHNNLDREVNLAFGATHDLDTDKQRLELLFPAYLRLAKRSKGDHPYLSHTGPISSREGTGASLD